MIMQSRSAVVARGLGLSLVALAILAVLASETVRFGQRPLLLTEDETAALTDEGPLVGAEQPLASRDAGRAGWAGHLRRVEDALAAKNVSAAELAWREAYGEALRSRRWEGLIEAGDTYLRLGEVAGARRASQAKARELYLAALFRARQQGSLDGVLRATEAFAALGDREVAEQGVAIAQHLATRARDAQAGERVRMVAHQLALRFAGLPSPEF
ncbi:MAG: hypothetical protein HY726_14065 [Candidatus Rokubacteria bacterium]|nr:hypothetical protein [Candidatus Rokubacteria bacterium]